MLSLYIIEITLAFPNRKSLSLTPHVLSIYLRAVNLKQICFIFLEMIVFISDKYFLFIIWLKFLFLCFKKCLFFSGSSQLEAYLFFNFHFVFFKFRSNLVIHYFKHPIPPPLNIFQWHVLNLAKEMVAVCIYLKAMALFLLPKNENSIPLCILRVHSNFQKQKRNSLGQLAKLNFKKIHANTAWLG